MKLIILKSSLYITPPTTLPSSTQAPSIILHILISLAFCTSEKGFTLWQHLKVYCWCFLQIHLVLTFKVTIYSALLTFNVRLLYDLCATHRLTFSTKFPSLSLRAATAFRPQKTETWFCSSSGDINVFSRAFFNTVESFCVEFHVPIEWFLNADVSLVVCCVLHHTCWRGAPYTEAINMRLRYCLHTNFQSVNLHNLAKVTLSFNISPTRLPAASWQTKTLAESIKWKWAITSKTGIVPNRNPSLHFPY